jgi:long-chain acyl-CoA synthetase
MAKPIAVVLPAEGVLRELIAKKGIVTDAGLGHLVKYQQVKDTVLEYMLKAGKTFGLEGIELISGVVLAPEPWTPENVPPFGVSY